MALDAVELLNVLDIIKNETIYSERLATLKESQNELKKIQEELNTSKYIVETVEIAQNKLDKADELLKEYQAKLRNVQSEIEIERTNKLADIVEREAKLDVKLDEISKREHDINMQLNQLRHLQVELKKANDILAAHRSESDKLRKEAQATKDLYENKREQLRKIIER